MTGRYLSMAKALCKHLQKDSKDDPQSWSGDGNLTLDKALFGR